MNELDWKVEYKNMRSDRDAWKRQADDYKVRLDERITALDKACNMLANERERCVKLVQNWIDQEKGEGKYADHQLVFGLQSLRDRMGDGE